MRRARWLAPWKDSREKPSIYHCISRVVDRRFAFGTTEREQFRTFMRMQENFTGCRVLSYCIMSNHFHILLEVPPPPDQALSDADLLKRLAAAYSPSSVATIRQELHRARADKNDDWAAQIHARYTYRMHNLSEFMKTLLQRFTSWFNRTHERKGTLWEERYKSVIVESGIAARTIAAYIDLNPVRAGMTKDPANYRWSSYGEAIGGGKKGNGKKSREGLVRACLSYEGIGFDAEKWPEVSKSYRSILSLALDRKSGPLSRENPAHTASPPLPDLEISAILAKKVRYFTDGAVIGSKSFVNETFAAARDRFPPTRKNGARRLRGNAAPASQTLWSVRDLRVNIGA